MIKKMTKKWQWLIKKMNVCQYYEKIPSKYSFKVSTILFDNKAKIKWERDNFMKKKI
jgi:hypothetical protein